MGWPAQRSYVNTPTQLGFRLQESYAPGSYMDVAVGIAAGAGNPFAGESAMALYVFPDQSSQS